jgi:hypothetical protein
MKEYDSYLIAMTLFFEEIPWLVVASSTGFAFVVFYCFFAARRPDDDLPPVTPAGFLGKRYERSVELGRINSCWIWRLAQEA